jgi:hypothetical protein
MKEILKVEGVRANFGILKKKSFWDFKEDIL